MSLLTSEQVEAWAEVKDGIQRVELAIWQGSQVRIVEHVKALFSDVFVLVCTFDPNWRTMRQTMSDALKQALDGWESLWRSSNNDEPPEEISELRKLVLR